MSLQLALLHKYGIITTLPLNKYAIPNLRKENQTGKHIDLPKINHLTSDEYRKNNQTVSRQTDAAKNMAVKNLFCELDFFQAYHCLQMAGQRSTEMLAFNFSSKTFAKKGQAPGPGRSPSASSSFTRENLDTVIKADHWAQYVEYIGLAANALKRLINNLRAVFKCIKKQNLKTPCQNATSEQKSLFHWRNHYYKWETPQRKKTHETFRKCQIASPWKSITTLHWLFKLLPKIHTTSKFTYQQNPFFQVLKTTGNKDTIIITAELIYEFREIK